MTEPKIVFSLHDEATEITISLLNNGKGLLSNGSGHSAEMNGPPGTAVIAAYITEREERIAALRALVDHHESEANERFTVEGNKKWRRLLSELRTAAGRREDGTWKEGT